MNDGMVYSLFLLGFGLVLTLALLSLRNRKQHSLHLERMAAIEKGVALPAPQPERPWSTRVYLLRGLIWSFCGAALFICLLGLSTVRRPPSAIARAQEAGRLSHMTGISMEQATQIVQKDRGLDPDQPPVSISLLGLLPFSVGLAYLFFYYTGERDRERLAPPER
jgi:hypothetical protein